MKPINPSDHIRPVVRVRCTVRRTFNLDIRATALATGASDQRRVRIRTF